MGECRFDRVAYCEKHAGQQEPALCTHAAARLEQRLAKAEYDHEGAKAALDVLSMDLCDLESNIARLEEEKAQVDALYSAASTKASISAQVVERLYSRLAQAEAAAGANFVAYTILADCTHGDEGTCGCREKAKAVLSPDAGRAQVAEVE